MKYFLLVFMGALSLTVLCMDYDSDDDLQIRMTSSRNDLTPEMKIVNDPNSRIIGMELIKKILTQHPMQTEDTLETYLTRIVSFKINHQFVDKQIGVYLQESLGVKGYKSAITYIVSNMPVLETANKKNLKRKLF